MLGWIGVALTPAAQMGAPQYTGYKKQRVPVTKLCPNHVQNGGQNWVLLSTYEDMKIAYKLP
jgi:hypothetical protein